jgi:hypothetical protein
MTPCVVFVPIPVPVLCASGNVGWVKRTPQPTYPSKRRENWPLSSPIPTDETRRTLDDARRRIASEREKLRELAHEGTSREALNTEHEGRGFDGHFLGKNGSHRDVADGRRARSAT